MVPNLLLADWAPVLANTILNFSFAVTLYITVTLPVFFSIFAILLYVYDSAPSTTVYPSPVSCNKPTTPPVLLLVVASAPPSKVTLYVNLYKSCSGNG